VSQQVKIPEDVKREVAMYAAVTGKGQGQLLVESWQEYKAHHREEFKKGLEWAASVLASPGAAAVYAAGLAASDIAEIDSALNG
jgi:hypothetical protein